MRKLFAFIPKIYNKIKSGFSDLNVKIGSIFETVFGASSTLIKIVFIFQALLSVVSLIVSAILVYQNIDTIVDLMTGVYEGNSAWLDKLVSIFSQYPAMEDVIADVDHAMVNTSGANYFTPALTLTGIIQTFGIGDAVNTIITCALQGVGFVISMRLFMWSMSRIKLSVTKPLG